LSFGSVLHISASLAETHVRPPASAQLGQRRIRLRGDLVADRFAQVSELRWHVIALRAVSPVSRRWLSALDT
jgi:hypothetical protein